MHHLRSFRIWVDKPPSGLLAIVPPSARSLCLIAFVILSFLLICNLTVPAYSNVWNSILYQLLASTALWHSCTRRNKRVASHCQPFGDVEGKDITHVLAVLHSCEPAQQLYSLVNDLKQLPCDGKKVLLIGFEATTPDYQDRLAMLEKLHGDGFHEILHTVHYLQEGELQGAGANHCNAQVAASLHFSEDMSNVIFSKFDTNMQLDNDRMLLREMEDAWCSADPDTRKGMMFMPRVIWSAGVPDEQRAFDEMFTTFGMMLFLSVMPFPMAFVSGSLQGLCEVGYTPPTLLSEEEAVYFKKLALQDRAAMYRLSSSIMKVAPTATKKCDILWFPKFLDTKVKRWFVGQLEVLYYSCTWTFSRRSLHDFAAQHQCVKNWWRCVAEVLCSIVRVYAQTVMMSSLMLCAWIGHENLWCWLPSLVTAFACLVSDVAQVYRDFASTRYNWRCIIGVMLSVIFLWLIFPFLFISLLRHGLLNQPVGHTMWNQAPGSQLGTNDPHDPESGAISKPGPGPACTPEKPLLAEERKTLLGPACTPEKPLLAEERKTLLGRVAGRCRPTSLLAY